MANRDKLLHGWKLIPDRAEQIAKMYGVDTSQLETPEREADTTPYFDRYHEFFVAKANEKPSGDFQIDEDEESISSSSSASSEASSSSSSKEESSDHPSLDDFVVK